MVDNVLERVYLSDLHAIRAFRTVPRHAFVPKDVRDTAYRLSSVDLGGGRVMTPPQVLAHITQEIAFKRTDNVLIAGTSSGYYPAIVSTLVKTVVVVEPNSQIADSSMRTISDIGCNNVVYHVGRSRYGSLEDGPFDVIICLSAGESIPSELLSQLEVGGRMLFQVRSLEKTIHVYINDIEGLQGRSIGVVELEEVSGAFRGVGR